MPEPEDLVQEEPLDLSDPANWSGNTIETSLSALDNEPEPEPEPEPAPPATDPTAELEALRREAAALREGLQVKSKIEAERGSQPAPQAPAPAPQQEITEQALREMWDQDPVRASALMSSRIADARASNLDTRLSTMLKASTAIVEAQVASRYAEDFADYGDEIRDVVRQFAPENQVEPSAWDAAVQIVRGRHMDDIVAKKMAAVLAKQGEEARAAQARNTGFSGTGRSGGGRAPAAPKADNYHGLSPEQRRVADTIGVSYKEYAKHV